MIKRLHDLNASYDRLLEPYRFLVAMAVVAPAIIANGMSIAASCFSIAWICLLLAFRLHRHS